MHFLPENRMCAPPFATKQRPPHLENPGSATANKKFVLLLVRYCKVTRTFDLHSLSMVTEQNKANMSLSFLMYLQHDFKEKRKHLIKIKIKPSVW